VLILGTLTTIAENNHKRLLLKRGIDESRVITQPCDGLATAIEKEPSGEAVVKLADIYIREAASKIGLKSGKLFVALCCTHFGYSTYTIEKKVKEYVTRNIETLNPNRLMGEFLFEPDSSHNYSKTNVDVRVVSRIKIDDIKIDSLSGLISEDSPETAEALAKYEYKPDLFTF
jgi:glutamate racemase